MGQKHQQIWILFNELKVFRILMLLVKINSFKDMEIKRRCASRPAPIYLLREWFNCGSN